MNEEEWEAMNDWRKHFDTINDFLINLSTYSGSTGPLDRISAWTIRELIKENNILKEALEADNERSS